MTGKTESDEVEKDASNFTLTSYVPSSFYACSWKVMLVTTALAYLAFYFVDKTFGLELAAGRRDPSDKPGTSQKCTYENESRIIPFYWCHPHCGRYKDYFMGNYGMSNPNDYILKCTYVYPDPTKQAPNQVRFILTQLSHERPLHLVNMDETTEPVYQLYLVNVDEITKLELHFKFLNDCIVLEFKPSCSGGTDCVINGEHTNKFENKDITVGHIEAAWHLKEGTQMVCKSEEPKPTITSLPEHLLNK